MSNWSDGYLTDINYTYGYYKELSPKHIIVPLLLEGIAVPEIKNACELGFGQGISINIHATAGTAQWYGTDVNPAQTAFAREVAKKANNDAILTDQSFAEFCQRDDLPEFEYIGLHGIWSWINDENRHIIVDFIRRKLAVGGILYISYNSLPGWAATSPIRHLMNIWNKNMASSTDDYKDRVERAMHFGEKVLAQSVGLTQNSAEISNFLNELKNKNFRYLAHEYLNQNWQPMYFTEVSDYLEPAKLSYVCSANYLEDFYDVNFSSEQAQLFDSLPAQARVRQTTKDYMLNKRFRRDLWVKGGYKLNPKRLNMLRGQLKFMLITERDKVSLSVTHHRQAQLYPEQINSILDILADKKPHSVNEIWEAVNKEHIVNEQLLFVLLTLLYTKQDLVLVQEQEQIDSVKERCHALNQYLFELAQSSSETPYLASPVTGEAVICGQIDALCAFGVTKGLKSPKELAKFIWDIFKPQGTALRKENKILQTDKENLAELESLADKFNKETLPMLRQLGIIA
ncbi:class I SAM-dependent methyltransferase [Conservatibacter flavescens]|uniref:Methyltransferase n=1 Tax=Conservatibacter flavescens TaxID=28161 RepID=A0A2M8S4G7_9PAST|nr:class I SAM-dependent methyltransferase [Conservatibacter flavescens]PJG86045.1 methyltransferase [Conservatibacter flavescens]